MKQLFNDTMKGQIDRFVSIDSTGLSIANVGVASRRYRVTFKGPGGHSFGSFGLANPIDAMVAPSRRLPSFKCLASRGRRSTSAASAAARR